MKKKEEGLYVKRKAEVVWKNTGGKTLLLDLKSGSYFEINSTGLKVWKLCDGQKTMSAIISKVVSKEIKKKEMRAWEINKFINQLQKNKLVDTSFKKSFSAQ